MSEPERRGVFDHNQPLLHGPLECSLDEAHYSEVKVHGCSLDQLLSYLPCELEPSSAPFIHPMLRTGIEDVNQINAAICLLRVQLEELSNPSCPFLKSQHKQAYELWSRTVRINALLVREALRRTYKTDEREAMLDTPSVVYKKDGAGNRFPPRPLHFYFFENKMTFKVHGWVAANTMIDNVPYIDSCGRLMVKENGQWIAMDGDWGPSSKDIKPDGTFVSGSIFQKWRGEYVQKTQPWQQTIPERLGQNTYNRIVNMVMCVK